MNEQDFPYTVMEDDRIIAKFKYIEDASSFASAREWQDVHNTVSIVSDRPTGVSTR